MTTLNTLEKQPLGNTGFSVTPLGYGSAPVGFLGREQETITEILNLLLDHGINLIDTAAVYPGSEEAIGNAVSTRRDEYVLVSKCGTPMGKTEDGSAPYSPQYIEYCIDRSLKRMKTDAIDVMLIHSCDLDTLKQGDAIEALLKAKDAGKVKFAGYAGDNEAAEWAATNDDFDVLEMSINITDQANIKNALATAHQNNKGVIAKRPIANACWKPMSDQEGMYQNYASTYHQRFQKMQATGQLTAEDLGFTETEWPEIALRFTLSQPGLTTAIVGTTKVNNLKANLAAAAKGPLDDATNKKIREAFNLAVGVGTEWWAAQT